MKKLLILFMAALLCACAKGAPQLPEPDAELEQARWLLMQTENPKPEPFKLQFSVRFGEEGNTRRVTGVAWGQNDQVRMDIMAGVGVTVAMIADNDGKFTLLSPREQRAYCHNGPDRPVLKIGMPLPFDIQALAALLNGRYATVFGQEYESSHMGKDDLITYELSAAPYGQLNLDAQAFPVSWQQKDNGWRMSISPEEGSRLPKSIKLANSDGKRAIILIKERENPAGPFDAAQMALTIPKGIKILPLAKYNPEQGQE